MEETLKDFSATIDKVYLQLLEMTDEQSSAPLSPGKWSRKQVLGHLIDSANNNHQRFVLSQIHGEFMGPTYEQEAWVNTQNYREENWADLIQLWRSYNRHLLHIMKSTPKANLGIRCLVAENEPVTLEFLMKDYVVHLKHHVGQLLGGG